MFPKLISIGTFFIPTYGTLIALAFLAGLWVTVRLAKSVGLDPEKITNLAVYCALGGLLGAKLLMFAFDYKRYAEHPGEIFSLATLQAAGVFQGGLVLALLFAVFYMRRAGLPFLATADAFAPGIAIGHAIGRIGCFAAGCCWGTECDRPWAVTFRNPDASELVGVPLGVPLHPAQLYEMSSEAILFALLYVLYRRPHRAGMILGTYLTLSSAARFVIEFFRYHEQALPFGGPLSITQWIALGLCGLGIFVLVRSSAGRSLVTPPVTAS